MKLSICMMIKNEEKNLVRCLDKLKPLVDEGLAELIIVDTGSEDNSINIAKQYTNRVYFHKWNKNFSEMRNISISYADGEWILLIDADERLDDVDQLIKLLNSNEIDNYNTVFFKVKNLYNISDESNYALISSPRMFKNDGEFKYTGAVHNQPIFKGPALSLEINITHFGYIIGDKKLMKTKFERTSEILKAELEKSPQNIYYIYQLGVTYDMHGDLKMALKNFRKAYNVLSKKGLNEKKNRVYVFASYAGIAYRNGEIQECIKIAKEGLELEKEYVDLYYDIAMCEKMLKNEEEAHKYFNKYLHYAERYNDLKISTDINLTMYYVNEKYKSIAYFELIKYYLKLEQYEKAYKIYNNIVIVNERIYSSINILIPLKKYSELREVYNKISSEKDKNIFLCTLEEKLKTLEDEEKINIYKVFSSNEDEYGLLNKIRVSKVAEDKKNLTIELVNKLDFNKSSLFYSEVFELLKEDINFIINIFEKIEMANLEKIVEYLIEEKEFIKTFEEWVFKFKNDRLSMVQTKILIAIADVLLLIYLRDNKTISKKYSELFKIYIEMGTNFVQKLYRVENSEEIYKSINNFQDRFFVIIYIVNKLIKQEHIKAAIRYISIAVNTYETFAKYIGIYKDEIFNLDDESISNEKNKEFDEYKVIVKKNIQTLIEQDKLDEAKRLIGEYDEIVKQDVEIFSMKAVIAIMENDLSKAENILKKGLEIDESNFDLNYNLAYLYEQSGKLDLAIDQYKKAKNYCNDNDKIQNIDEIIKQIIDKNPNLNKCKQKLVFFVKQGMDSFLDQIIKGVSKQYETKKVIVNNYNQIDNGMEWADICWFEWCDELVIYGSKHTLAEKKKIICRLHSYEAFAGYPTNVNWNVVDKLIFVGENIRKFVVDKYKIDKQKTVVIPNGVDINKYKYKERKAGFNIAYVGYINFKKGPMLLLHTFKAIYDKDSRYKLYIAGKFQDDRDVLYYQQMIKELGLENSVIYQGWQDNLDEWLENKNYILCTSVLESQNMSVMQAMCKGIKPVIHNFVGAKEIYNTKYVWNTIEEAVSIINSKEYYSKEYNEYISKNYSLESNNLLIIKAIKNEKKSFSNLQK